MGIWGLSCDDWFMISFSWVHFVDWEKKGDRTTYSIGGKFRSRTMCIEFSDVWWWKHSKWSMSNTKWSRIIKKYSFMKRIDARNTELSWMNHFIIWIDYIETWWWKQSINQFLKYIWINMSWNDYINDGTMKFPRMDKVNSLRYIWRSDINDQAEEKNIKTTRMKLMIEFKMLVELFAVSRLCQHIERMNEWMNFTRTRQRKNIYEYKIFIIQIYMDGQYKFALFSFLNSVCSFLWNFTSLLWSLHFE
jgi:hypothetical protein